MQDPPSRPRRRRPDGERSRQAILRAAADLATIEGLEGLSIGKLAGHIGMSKSGLYAHFGSKEDLQLATVEEAHEIFTREVTKPAMERPSGVERVTGLSEAFLSHLERRVFPGGCFFAATGAELSGRTGPVLERIKEFFEEWLALLAAAIREAQDAGELDPSTDPEQLAFEVDSLLLGANAGFVLFDDVGALSRARRAIEERLGVGD